MRRARGVTLSMIRALPRSTSRLNGPVDQCEERDARARSTRTAGGTTPSAPSRIKIPSKRLSGSSGACGSGQDRPQGLSSVGEPIDPGLSLGRAGPRRSHPGAAGVHQQEAAPAPDAARVPWPRRFGIGDIHRSYTAAQRLARGRAIGGRQVATHCRRRRLGGPK
jgi:hypothetical protein